MREKLAGPEGRRLHARRKQTVEPVFGIRKSAMGFRAFRLRRQAKVRGERSPVCLAYDFQRLWKLAAISHKLSPTACKTGSSASLPLGFPSSQYVFIQLRWKTCARLAPKPICGASATKFVRNGR
ncbi:transposase [Methylacidimicrobium sp. AP8]|uniref:transposase n=1 Tax=Methylacidimicrobium sp. AP8 TaxID=2730359 RepID=UPI001F1C44EF|nr:transposase [Methylacidimicrobium sp. AP8]